MWKSTLSGQPPPPKPQQPSSAWGHTPQNPTDYKNWGEEELVDNNGGSTNGPIGSQAPGGPNSASSSHMGSGSGFGTGASGNSARNDGNFWGNEGPNGPQQYNGTSQNIG